MWLPRLRPSSGSRLADLFHKCTKPREPVCRLWRRSGLFAPYRSHHDRNGQCVNACASFSVVVGYCGVASCVGRSVHGICVVSRFNLCTVSQSFEAGLKTSSDRSFRRQKKPPLPGHRQLQCFSHSGHGHHPRRQPPNSIEICDTFLDGTCIIDDLCFADRRRSNVTNDKNALVASVTSRLTLKTGDLPSCRHISNARQNTQQI